MKEPKLTIQPQHAPANEKQESSVAALLALGEGAQEVEQLATAKKTIGSKTHKSD